MMPGDMTGSWFPSGFHGHFRTKFRNDFVQDYRIAARPPPPELLLQRLKDKPKDHCFSKLDNRELFRRTAVYFENGFGAKHVFSPIAKTANFKPELLTWGPLKAELVPADPISTYRTTFCLQESPKTQRPRLLFPPIPLPSTSNDPYKTTYHHTFCHQPLPEAVTSSRAYRETPCKLHLQTIRRLAPLTVSDCLRWPNL